MGVAPPPPGPSGVIERVRSDLRSQRAARGGWPPGELSFSLRRTREFESEPLPLLLRLPRALRAGVHDPPALPADRVRARPRGEPLHHRLARLELPLARRRDGRPDPAARRRPAHHRRRLPPARPPDHAARLPPRAARGVDGDHGRGDRAGASRAGTPDARMDLYALDAPAGAARSRCARCSASIPTAARATPRWPRSSRRRSATGARTT